MLQGYNIYVGILFISSAYAIWKFSKLSFKYKWAAILIIFILFIEIIVTTIANMNKIQTPVYHLVFPIQFMIYGIYFGLSQNKKILYLVLSICCVFFSIVNSIWIQSIFMFPSYSLILLSLAIVTTVLFDFTRLMKVPSKIKLTSLPDFWFNLGHLVFFSSTFFVIAFINSMVNIDLMWPYYLIIIANLFLYSCYGLSLYLDSKITNEHTT